MFLARVSPRLPFGFNVKNLRAVACLQIVEVLIGDHGFGKNLLDEHGKRVKLLPIPVILVKPSEFRMAADRGVAVLEHQRKLWFRRDTAEIAGEEEIGSEFRIDGFGDLIFAFSRPHLPVGEFCRHGGQDCAYELNLNPFTKRLFGLLEP